MLRWKSLIVYQTTKERNHWNADHGYIVSSSQPVPIPLSTIIVLTFDSRDRVHVGNSSQKSIIRSRMYVHTLHYLDLLHNAMFASHARSIHQGFATVFYHFFRQAM